MIPSYEQETRHGIYYDNITWRFPWTLNKDEIDEMKLSNDPASTADRLTRNHNPSIHDKSFILTLNDPLDEQAVSSRITSTGGTTYTTYRWRTL